MSASLNSVGAITLFVEDPQRSKAFYENVFDSSAIYEDESSAAFRFENTIVNLLKTPAARGLIDPGVVAGREPDRGSSSRSRSMTRTPSVRSWQRAA